MPMHNAQMQRQKSIRQTYGSAESNKCGYLRLNSSSASQVVSSIEWCLQITFIKVISLFRSLLTWRSTILTETSSYDKSDLSSTDYGAKTWDGSEIYFLRSKTWNTGWIEANWGGNANSYTMALSWPIISKGPMYLGLNLPFFPNLITPFIGDTFRNT